MLKMVISLVFTNIGSFIKNIKHDKICFSNELFKLIPSSIYRKEFNEAKKIIIIYWREDYMISSKHSDYGIGITGTRKDIIIENSTKNLENRKK